MSSPINHEVLIEKIHSLENEMKVRIQAMLDLEKQVEQYRSLLEHARDLIHSVRPDGTFLYVNQAWKDALGYSEEEVREMKLMDIIDPDCHNKCRKVFQRIISGENIERNETVFIGKSGRKITVEGRCTTHFVDGKATRMTGFFRDISERCRNEAALRESETRYRALFENAHDLIQLIRPDGKLLFVNEAWRKTFGYTEEEIENGLKIFDLISADCLDQCQNTFQKVLSEEKTHYISSVFAARDGRKVFIEGNAICRFEDGSPLYTQCILRDVTEKKKMEEELIKAQKLESVGIFAGGIAHDFNNLLQAIIGNISLAKMYISPESKAYERLQKTENASQLATDLTHQLLTFSKGGEPVKAVTDIKNILTEASTFSLRGTNVKCEYDMAADLFQANVDKGQLSQVIQNLTINASQAMPDGGTFRITARNVHLDDNDLYRLPAGDYLQLTFTDEGVGISAENLPKIFDPYFTSKKTGSGLGLAISYSIINNHGGLITVESTLGKGTGFTVHLPAAPAQTEILPIGVQTGKTREGYILLLDDEAIVLETLREMLDFLGCQTDEATDGEQAVRLYQKALKNGRPYDGIIMDLTIPGGMGGKETLDRIREIDPQVKAIVSSGYANNPIMADYRRYGFCGLISKPYKMEDLSQALCVFFP